MVDHFSFLSDTSFNVTSADVAYAVCWAQNEEVRGRNVFNQIERLINANVNQTDEYAVVSIRLSILNSAKWVPLGDKSTVDFSHDLVFTPKQDVRIN